jgi:hypothetical protein
MSSTRVDYFSALGNKGVEPSLGLRLRKSLLREGCVVTLLLQRVKEETFNPTFGPNTKKCLDCQAKKIGKKIGTNFDFEIFLKKSLESTFSIGLWEGGSNPSVGLILATL